MALEGLMAGKRALSIGAVAMASERTRYGSGVNTKSAALDAVILDFPVDREFNESEVIEEIRRRGLPERGAVGNHLRALRDRGFLRQSGGGWVRVD
jgi:hypothetical protein